MNYSVKANDWIPDVVIHKASCGHARKRGGVGKYGQVHWEDFNSLEQAENYARVWRRKGYTLKYCKHCRP